MYQIKKEFKDSIITVGKYTLDTKIINPNQYQYFISIGFGNYFEEIIKCIECDGLGCKKCDGFGILAQEPKVQQIETKKTGCKSCKSK